jgi:hypothetical protein
VILIGKYAIKIPLGVRGILQGYNEDKLYRMYGHTKLLAPLRFFLLGVVVQRRVEPLNEFSVRYPLRVKRAIPSLDIDNCDLYNRANWGRYRGRIVLLDYGINKRIAKMYSKP